MPTTPVPPPDHTAAATPDRILQLGLAFWGARTLLSAVELGVFTHLAEAGPQSADAIAAKLSLHPRARLDFLDALVALGVLTRTKDVYANAPDADRFLDRRKPGYVGGLLEMAAARLYPIWGSLTEALHTGDPQNEAKRGENFFAKLYADPARLRQFLSAMTGLSAGAAQAIAAKLDWSKHKTFCDVGCAQGGTPVIIAQAHPHLRGVGFDLPPVRPIFEEYAADANLSNRLRFHAGDFTKDLLPRADVIIMGHILHDWGLEEKRALVRKAYEALPPGGAFVVYEALIDDERRTNAFGLLMSLNMLVETPDGFDFTGADCSGWMRDAGFARTRVEHLAGPDWMVVGVK